MDCKDRPWTARDSGVAVDRIDSRLAVTAAAALKSWATLARRVRRFERILTMRKETRKFFLIGIERPETARVTGKELAPAQYKLGNGLRVCEVARRSCICERTIDSQLHVLGHSSGRNPGSIVDQEHPPNQGDGRPHGELGDLSPEAGAARILDPRIGKLPQGLEISESFHATSWKTEKNEQRRSSIQRVGVRKGERVTGLLIFEKDPRPVGRPEFGGEEGNRLDPALRIRREGAGTHGGLIVVRKRTDSIRREGHSTHDPCNTPAEIRCVLPGTTRCEPVKHRPKIPLKERRLERVFDLSFGVAGEKSVESFDRARTGRLGDEMFAFRPQERLEVVDSMLSPVGPLSDEERAMNPVPGVIGIGIVDR
jgi:hypothetical protein